MKLNNIYTLALAALSLAACSPEDFDGVSEAGLPVAENAKVTATVDDATNTVTFNIAGDGIYPMWYIPVDGKEGPRIPCIPLLILCRRYGATLATIKYTIVWATAMVCRREWARQHSI
ncbi:hypothetical protein [Prevotella sp.]|uniref:hypothetical protein n=1 Tax=Prevotella sp. TaxID=59823 RepID=UPI0027E373AD|nr:hypothetical protein [Prevotella sp.]